MVYVWRCTGCDLETEVERPMSQCTVQPGPEAICDCTGEETEGLPTWQRVFTPAMITKASYPDGVRKFTELREAHKLEKESRRSQNKETKKEIAAEIRKLGVRIKK